MIRIVCNWYKYHCAIYEIQVMSRKTGKYVTMHTFNSILEGVRRFGTAIIDEYPMTTNKMV